MTSPLFSNIFFYSFFQRLSFSSGTGSPPPRPSGAVAVTTVTQANLGTSCATTMPTQCLHNARNRATQNTSERKKRWLDLFSLVWTHSRDTSGESSCFDSQLVFVQTLFTKPPRVPHCWKWSGSCQCSWWAKKGCKHRAGNIGRVGLLSPKALDCYIHHGISMYLIDLSGSDRRMDKCSILFPRDSERPVCSGLDGQM